ncbi:MAG: AAA family ATPase, partial [Candidatus Aminicenantes bacterium]|nr:AAA family ATPase [Candidatus Aminicenantes bacterium]
AVTNNKNAAANTPISQEYKGGYKLEIGKHTFKDRILDNCIYVDKTQYIFELMGRESNCFLSRPRRFGKSLLISTFKEIFSGSKNLFKNCRIYDKIDWLEYPIIHLDFLEIDFKKPGLEPAIDEALNSLADKFNVELHKKSIKGKFGELIEILAKDKKVVVLIDEYDKPIIDYLGNIPEAEKNRDILKNFYSTLEAQTHHLKFLLITGVSKFSRVSIFSDLNHLKDITIHPRYAKMLGYTQEEIEYYFSYYIAAWEKKTGEKREFLFEKLKDYYNGYSWDGINFVYNPFSILSFFDTYLFKNYWFATGSPTFLVNILKKTGISIDRYERMSVSGNFFEKFDIGTIGIDNISSLLFQTGYLTIKEIKDQVYILSYPNREVKTAFLQYLLESFSNKPEY